MDDYRSVELKDAIMMAFLSRRADDLTYVRENALSSAVTYTISDKAGILGRICYHKDVGGHVLTTETCRAPANDPERREYWDAFVHFVEYEPKSRQQVIDLIAPSQDDPQPMTTEKRADKSRGPTVRTQIRGEVFKELKDQHPEWSQTKVAMKAGAELGEDVTADTVRNTYRAMGWKWERADRVR